jgi:hypothetical protein
LGKSTIRIICDCGNELEKSDVSFNIPNDIKARLNLLCDNLDLYTCDHCGDEHFHGINDSQEHYEL